jgi:hypothetical protein
VAKSRERSETNRCVVQVKMSLLQTFAMVPLWVGQAEESLLEEWAICQVSGQVRRGILTNMVQTYSFSFQKAKAIFS